MIDEKVMEKINKSYSETLSQVYEILVSSQDLMNKMADKPFVDNNNIPAATERDVVMADLAGKINFFNATLRTLTERGRPQDEKDKLCVALGSVMCIEFLKGVIDNIENHRRNGQALP